MDAEMADATSMRQSSGALYELLYETKANIANLLRLIVTGDALRVHHSGFIVDPI